MDFYAHSTKRADKADWQPLAAHLISTGEKAGGKAAVFGCLALGETAGRLHDLGKYTGKFQYRLEGDLSRVDHATWGAHIARNRYGGIGTLLAYGIAGHHTGLADGRPGQEPSRSTLQERLSDDYRDHQLPPLAPEWEHEIALPASLPFPEGFARHPKQPSRVFQMTLLARMLFSCLVDADFCDTDDFYRQVEGSASREQEAGPRTTLAQLRLRLDAHLATFPAEGGINPVRARILHAVRAKAGERPGLFSLTVPTGGGKTLASLAFALDHALAHGLRRVIYVIPFTSIVEQTVQVFRTALDVPDDRDDIVLEHHSAFFDDPAKAPQSIEKRKLAMENWDAPVVVTTAVQFFESLFADRPSRCRKLHNIAGSVVILDEAQTLPHALLRPCVAVLDELARNYRVSPVLCTATQPALRLDQGFKDGLENVCELAPDPPALYDELRRVRVRHVGVLDDDALADHLRRREQVLCIVNNRRHARHLFESIADCPGARHLTTLMHARHRSAVLAEVREDLKAGRPCRLISTSLIEAGVDISLPTVLRAEAGLDSIAQAAGRCNREGLWPADASEVLVFEPANPDWAPPRELKLFAEVFRSIERQYRDDLLAMEAVAAYFRELYFRLGDGRLDRDDLLGLLKNRAIDDLPLDTLASRFKMIRTTMRPLIVPFVPGHHDDAPEIAPALRQLEHGEQVHVGTIARSLQPWLVQVPEQAYRALWQARAIAPVAPDRYGEQFVRLINPRLYDTRFGLHWEQPQFLAAELCVY